MISIMISNSREDLNNKDRTHNSKSINREDNKDRETINSRIEVVKETIQQEFPSLVNKI